MRKHFRTVSRVLASKFFTESREIEILGDLCLLRRKVYRGQNLINEQALIFPKDQRTQMTDGSVHIVIKARDSSCTAKDVISLRNPENPEGEVHIFRPVAD